MAFYLFHRGEGKIVAASKLSGILLIEPVARARRLFARLSAGIRLDPDAEARVAATSLLSSVLVGPTLSRLSGLSAGGC